MTPRDPSTTCRARELGEPVPALDPESSRPWVGRNDGPRSSPCPELERRYRELEHAGPVEVEVESGPLSVRGADLDARRELEQVESGPRSRRPAKVELDGELVRYIEGR